MRKAWIFVSAIYVWLGVGWAPALAQSESLSLQKVQLSVQGNRRSVLFQFSRPPDAINSFALSSPSRLVIDVRGPHQGTPTAAYQADDELLAQVRLGTHPDHLRLVLDLKQAEIPPFSVEQRTDRVVIVFVRENGAEGEAYSQILFSHTNRTVEAPPKRKIARARPARPATPVPTVPPPLPTPAPQSAAETPAQPSDPVPPRSLSSQALLHLRQGQEFYDTGDLNKAIAEWRETVRLTPTNAKAHHLLGLALGDHGARDEAIDMLQASLQLDPHNAMAHVHLARTLEANGETQEAVAAYRKALQLVPTSSYIHDRLGHIFAAQGKHQAAADEWQQAIALDPDYAYTHANLGEALESLGQKTQALAAYERAIELDPQASFASEVQRRITRLRASES